MWQVVVIAVGAPVVLFFLTCWTLRQVFMRLSGWGRLHRRHACGSPPDGWAMRGESATVGPIRFRRIVRAAAAGDGLHLAIGGIVPLPSIRIPWQDFVALRQARFYRETVIELILAQPLPAIQVSPSMYARIRASLPLPPVT